MRFACVAGLLVLLTSTAFGVDALLAPVRNLECAAKRAVRFTQGATTQGKVGGPTAFVKAVAKGSYPTEARPNTCDVTMTLHVRYEGGNELEFPLGHNTDADFDLVDWSPRADEILISSRRWVDPVNAPKITLFNVKSKTHRFIDVAALFASEGWIHCAAIIETTGFTPDGHIAVYASVKRPPDCTPAKSYWAFDPKNPKVQQLSPDYRQREYGRVIAPEQRPCKGDPGIVDSCYTVHGRVQYGNGSPGLRIWRIGTDRMLGVLDSENEIIPANLANQLDGFGTAVFGDFEVCPFTKSKASEMQMVCVESAQHLVVKHY